MSVRHLLLAALVLLPLSALAAEAPAKSPDGKTELALELMHNMHYDQTLKAMGGQIEDMMQRQFSTLSDCDAAKPVLGEYSKALSNEMSAMLTSTDIKADVAAVYSESFSADELRELIRFYQSPLGEKLLDRMPGIMQKTMQLSQEWMRAQMPKYEKLSEQYEPRLREASKQCKATGAAAAPTPASN